MSTDRAAFWTSGSGKNSPSASPSSTETAGVATLSGSGTLSHSNSWVFGVTEQTASTSRALFIVSALKTHRYSSCVKISQSQNWMFEVTELPASTSMSLLSLCSENSDIDYKEQKIKLLQYGLNARG